MAKLFHIKIENFFRYDRDGHMSIDYGMLSRRISELCLDPDDLEKRILFSMVFEPHHTEMLDVQLFPMLSMEMRRRDIVDWVVLLSNTFQQTIDHRIENLQPENYLYIDYWALRTMVRCNDPWQTINDSWNQSAKKALLLTGKAHVLNRMVLLSRFYDIGIIDRLTWSLHLSDRGMEACRGMLPHYSDDEYSRFVKECRRNPDHAVVEMRGDSSHYDGFPYDPKLYSSTLFSIVSESFYSMPWFIISEKTYRAMMNMHPFVMAGPPGNVAFLESMGFETFRDKLPIPGYDSILDPYERLDAIVENCMAFFDIAVRDRDAISSAVVHNKKILISRCQSGLHALRQRFYRDLSDDRLFDLIRSF